jgi:hypothetical protein
MLRLHTAATPNGKKISIALEELALPYEMRQVNLQAEEQLRPEFLALNPPGYDRPRASISMRLQGTLRYASIRKSVAT